MSDNTPRDFLSDLNFKSSFAQSLLVGFKQEEKTVDVKTPVKCSEPEDVFLWKASTSKKCSTPEVTEPIRYRKNCRPTDETRRYSSSNTSFCCFNKVVENRAYQSRIETLTWQPQQTQKSREMYRAVMRHVVAYLDKAHKSLEILGTKMNKKHLNNSLKSECHTTLESSSSGFGTSTPTKGHNETADELASYKDFSWKQTKSETLPEEIHPAKLASEAFRLLRIVQSLLNTCEPDLARLPQAKESPIESESQPMTDVDFLTQLAKEFPSNKLSNQIEMEHRPQRATSFSLTPKVQSTEPGVKMAFNRKLSLQLSEVRRTSNKVCRISDSGRESVAESELELLNDIERHSKQKNKTEKSGSSGNGSVSSVEDESGFSSMNSFQDVGLPLVNSTLTEEVATRKALLSSMLHDSTTHRSSLSHSSLSDNTIIAINTCQKSESSQTLTEDVKVWQRSSIVPQHKRWYSTPVEDRIDPNQNLKVLWV